MSWLLLLVTLVGAEQDGLASAAEHLELIEIPVGVGQIADLNDRGELVGWHEVEMPGIGLRQEAVFIGTDRVSRTVPMLRGYTNMESTAICDAGAVVGYAGRVMGHPEGSLEAFYWNTRSAESEGLGRLPGDRSSHAFDVSGDGQVVVGYSVGADPPRMVPCVWQRDETGWKCLKLITPHGYNPFLLTSRVVVSDDGTRIAACVTTEVVSGVVTRYVSRLCHWRRSENGEWSRRWGPPEALKLAGINNQGTIAGTREKGALQQALRIAADETIELLAPLPDDVTCQAHGINSAGVVVGVSDLPSRTDAGPRAVLWRNAQAVPLALPAEFPSSEASAINDKGQIAGRADREATPEQPGGSSFFVLTDPARS